VQLLIEQKAPDGLKKLAAPIATSPTPVPSKTLQELEKARGNGVEIGNTNLLQTIPAAKEATGSPPLALAASSA